ncbi:MAG: CBS domain-containing protein [Nostocales cyanobacterium 94392]|uniref:CBS domain-containing protein n=1 Tax=Plectonema cf. radiosum LEGE 06105 TaxID=945769 RepID=A0A8J7K034_9CYAN|nr:CBS domain-containing protein [Plectonema radiosum]MBE9213226.1 CBS domain-containing protein [Plectonema cf. radiosum LEGE 06105]MEB3219427.1 CBS domain-containing protein [Nostocales cyanobacterium 94392]
MLKTVAEVMTPNPITVKVETPLREAIKILAEKNISGLPVVDDAGQLIGIISETDLMWQQAGVTPPAYIMILDSVIYLKNPVDYERELHKALGQIVGEVMSKKPITISADKPLREAAKLMRDRKIHQLPVLDDSGQLVGILALNDIIREMAASQG